MMNNLFSMFDPSSFYWWASWGVLATPMLMVKSMGKKDSPKKWKAMMMVMNKIKGEVSEMNGSSSKKMTEEMLSTLFITVAAMNMVAIMPFNFTATAHMSTSLPLALMLWMSTMVNAVCNSMKKTLSHLTPLGTPTALMNFMVMIELVSNLIRPITLSVRLMANMVAGHLLMSLLSNFSLSGASTITGSTMPMITLISLEMAVAIIQAYVITTLVSLYYSETF